MSYTPDSQRFDGKIQRLIMQIGPVREIAMERLRDPSRWSAEHVVELRALVRRLTDLEVDLVAFDWERAMKRFLVTFDIPANRVVVSPVDEETRRWLISGSGAWWPLEDALDGFVGFPFQADPPPGSPPPSANVVTPSLVAHRVRTELQNEFPNETFDVDTNLTTSVRSR